MAGQTLSYNPPFQQAQPGSVSPGGGGGLPIVGARSTIDMRRMMMDGRTPEAQYPDGYAGATGGRYQDRLLRDYGGPGARYDRPYQKGVHAGDRISPEEYKWPSWLNPMSGIQNQATGKRWAPRGPVPDAPSIPGIQAQEAQTGIPTADLMRFRPSWK